MSQQLDSLVATVIQSKLAKGELIIVFTSGVPRGKLTHVAYHEEAIPATTYLKVPARLAKPEPCVELTFIPSPRQHSKVQDPFKFKFTRNPRFFTIPTRALVDGLHLVKISDGLWMLNLNTGFKGGELDAEDV